MSSFSYLVVKSTALRQSRWRCDLIAHSDYKKITPSSPRPIKPGGPIKLSITPKVQLAPTPVVGAPAQPDSMSAFSSCHGISSLWNIYRDVP